MWGRRKNDEDPFAALKDDGTLQSRPTTAADMGLGSDSTGLPQAKPVPSTATVRPTSVASRPRASATGPTAYSSYARVYRPGASVMWRLGIVIFIIAVAAIPLISAVNRSVHSISIPSFSTPSPTTPVGPSTPSAPSTTSYLSSSSLRGALRRIAGIAPNSRVSLLRIDGSSLSTTAVLPNGAARTIYFGPAGTFTASTSVPAQGSVPVFEIRPSAIDRILAGMRHHFHVPASQIDYMVLTELPSRGPSWILFTKTAAHTGYSATLAGTGVAAL